MLFEHLIIVLLVVDLQLTIIMLHIITNIYQILHFFLSVEQFCKDLEAKGIELDGEYRYAEALSLGVAFVTDPWGTRIELTEGLGEY